MKITIISPHIDDAIYSMWGLVWKWAKEWYIVDIITVFSKTNYMWPKKQLWEIENCMKIRKEEEIKIKKQLWKNVNFFYLDYEEAILRWYPLNDVFWTVKDTDYLMIEWLNQELEEYVQDSDFIFIPYGYGGHVDHVICSCLFWLKDNVYHYSDMPYICYDNEQLDEWWYNYNFSKLVYKNHVKLWNNYKSQMYLDEDDNYVLSYLLKNGYTFYWQNKRRLNKIMKDLKTDNHYKIPKRLIYCWFGKWEKNDLMKSCMKTWEEKLPDYEIIEFNEENSPINKPFVKKMLSEKKYAFASDYVRIWALYNFGWVYLDTDVELVKDLDDLLDDNLFIWFEMIYRYRYVNNLIC